MQPLALVRGRQEPIDLLISDVILPGLSGDQVAKAITAERPRLPVLFISGYAEHHLTQNGVLQPDVSFLEKPFTPTQLATKVREVLGGSAAGAPV